MKILGYEDHNKKCNEILKDNETEVPEMLPIVSI
jgi:hypothetical protein